MLRRVLKRSVSQNAVNFFLVDADPHILGTSDDTDGVICETEYSRYLSLSLLVPAVRPLA